MAKRRRKTTRRRKNRTLSSGGGVRRRSPRRRRRGLSEGGKKSWKEALMSVGGGAVGAGAAVVVNKLIMPASAGKIPRVITALIAGLAAAKFNLPNVGAGFTGGTLALAFQNGVLADDADFANQNSLSDAPIFLAEDGTPLTLAEDGNGYRELSDDEINALDKAGAFAEYELVQ